MTKYICECLDGARKCTHETTGFSAPTLCCVRAHATCHWRKVENQGVETPVPTLSEWCKVGTLVYITPDNSEPFYGKVYSLYSDGQGVWVKKFNEEFITAFTKDTVSPARFRPWDDVELKSKVGKVFEDDAENLTLCFRYQRGNETLHFSGKIMSAESLAESDWKLDGSPCGVLEHKNDLGEWVK